MTAPSPPDVVAIREQLRRIERDQRRDERLQRWLNTSLIAFVWIVGLAASAALFAAAAALIVWTVHR